MILWTLHGATWEDEGIVAIVSGRKGFAGQFYNPIMEIIVTRHD